MLNQAGLKKDDIRRAFENAPAEQLEPPDLLRREPPPPEPFPVSVLGPILAPATRRMMEAIKAPDAICAQSVLGAASLAVQPHANIVIDGRVKPVCTFQLTIAESGERKSAADDEALKAHYTYQQKLVAEYEEERFRYEADLVAWTRARDEVKRGNIDKDCATATREAIREALEELGPEPAPPTIPVLIASDPTLEGIYKLLAAGRPSIGMFSDEAGTFFGGWAMNKDNALRTAAGLSKLWDGKPLDRVRGGDGSSLLYGRRVSLHLMMQPVVAETILSSSVLSRQGFLARCLPAWPVTTAGTRFYNALNLSQDAVMLAYWARMRDILETELPLEEDTRNQLRPKRLPLSVNAKQLWVAFHDTIEAKLGPGKDLALVRAFASKAAEHAARLGGVLTLVEDLEAPHIDEEHLAAGIELADYYLNEVVRIHDTHSINPDIPLAERLLEWAQQQPVELIYPRKVYQFGPNAIREKAVAKRIIGMLEDHRWLIPLDGGAVVDGAHRQNVWRVVRAE